MLPGAELGQRGCESAFCAFFGLAHVPDSPWILSSTVCLASRRLALVHTKSLPPVETGGVRLMGELYVVDG